MNFSNGWKHIEGSAILYPIFEKRVFALLPVKIGPNWWVWLDWVLKRKTIVSVTGDVMKVQYFPLEWEGKWHI